MKMVKPKIIIINPPKLTEVINRLITPARNCYQSFDKSEKDADTKLIQHLVERGHTSILEQFSLQYIMVSNRGVHNEDVRHRTGISHAAESSRWVNYSQEKFGEELCVIDSLFFEKDKDKRQIWHQAMLHAETAYMLLLELGASAQEAREVLPLSLKISDVQTANCTGLKNRFNQRCAKTAHPEYRRLMLPFLRWCYETYPILFDDQYHKFSIEYERFEATYGSDNYAEIIVTDEHYDINTIAGIINHGKR